MWGDTGSITFDFEADGAHRANTSNSYGKGPQVYTQNSCSISCAYMDVVTTGTPLTGSANALGRVAKNTTNSPTLTIGPIDMSNKTITGISYKTKGANTMTQTCTYSTDNSSWSTAVAGFTLLTTAASKSSGTLSITGTSTFYVKIATVVASSTTSNRDLQIDDVVISYETEDGEAPTPTVSFDPEAGTFCETQSVTLSSDVEGATIYYTTDGTTPTTNSSTYSSAISVSSTKTIKAFAKKDSNTGDVVSATYNITAKEDPTITFNNGSVDEGQSLNLSTLFSSNSEGAVTYSITAGNSYASISGSTLTGVDAGSVTVQASQAANGCNNAKVATATVTVNEHVVTPGKYTLTLANALWGTSYTSSTTSTSANALDLSGSSNDVQVTLTNGTSTSMYITNDQTRAYAGYTLTFSVPSGYNITKIKFTKATKWGLVCASGLNDDKDTWEGEASSSVEFTFSARTDLTSVDVTFEEVDNTIVKTLKSIAVSEMTTTFEVGEAFSFDGTCTATYSVTQGGEAQPDENKTVDPTSVSSPDMSTTGEKTITVTYTENEVSKTTTYTITVNEHEVTAGEYTITFNNALFGTIGLNGSLSGSNLKDYSGIKNDITIDYKKGTGSNMYLKDSEIRLYSGNLLVVTAPTGFAITKVDKLVAGINADNGEIDENNVWTGEESSVTFSKTGNGGLALSSFKVTYAEVDPTAPAVTVASSIDDVPAAGVTDQVLDVIYTNITLANVAVARFNDAACTEAFTGNWLSASLNSDKDIVYSVAANTSFTESRTAYIQLTAPASNGTSADVVKVIAVEQLKKDYVFASLAELLENVTPTATGVDVTVTFANEVIRDIALSGQYRNGVYFDVTYGNPAQTKRIELYFHNVPDGWEIGDKLSGTLTACPWKVYNSTWELAPKTGWEWTSLTCTPKGDIASITVSGDATKTEYSNGESFLFDGLVATATYENGYQEEITPDSWAANPATVTATGNVAVTATVGSVISDPYNVAVTVAAKTLESIAVGTASYTIYTGETLPKPTVTATYSEGEPEDVSALAVYDTESVFDTESLDDYSVTVSYTFGGETKTTTYTVTVKDYANDAAHPYTVAEAIYIITNAIGTTASARDIYVQGIVSQKSNPSNNAQTYYISDDGNKVNELEIYKGKYINGANFTNANQVLVSDEVVVVGKVKMFNTTPEFDTGSTLQSLARTPNFEIEDVASLEIGAEDLAVSDLTVEVDGDGAITLVSGDEAKATIVNNKIHAVAEGTVTITANLAADGIYKAAQTTFDVTVIAAVTRYAVTISDNGADGGSAPDAIADKAAGDPVTLPANTWTKTGHNFDGWKVINNTTSAEITVTDGAFTMPASAVTIQAQWAEISGWANVYDNNVIVKHTDSGTDDGTITISETEHKLVKAGASSNTGTIKVTVPKGTTDLHFHAFAWGGKTAKIQIAGVTNPSVSEFDLAGESGASGSGNAFTLQGNPVDQYFHVSFDAVANETEIVFSKATGSADNRFFFYGVNAEGGDFGSYQRDVTAGRYGTICLPNGGRIVGAAIFEIAYYKEIEEKIYFDEIESGVMVAGRPYIFWPMNGATQLKVNYTDALDEVAGNWRGLYGSYEESAIAQNAGNYVLYQNMYYLVNSDVTVGENRAYIKLDEAPTNDPGSAPGRRRVAMGVQGKEVATGILDVEASDQPMKVMIDNQLYIIRAGHMYDMTGNKVK